MLLENGWNDDLFPVEQALRAYNQIRALKGYAVLMFGDVGHLVASNKENTDDGNEAEGAAFFAAKLKREGKPPKNGSVTAYTETCPKSAPGGGPYSAKNWPALHPDTVTFGESTTQSFTSAGASPAIAAEFDPVCGHVCAGRRVQRNQIGDGTEQRDLHHDERRLSDDGVADDHSARGHDRRLRSGRRTPVGRAAQRRTAPGQPRRYRLTEDQTATIEFQLHGNGYEFAKGDTVKLELLGRDAPLLPRQQHLVHGRSQRPVREPADDLRAPRLTALPRGAQAHDGEVARRVRGERAENPARYRSPAR